MKYDNIADIYSANDKFHERLSLVLSQISPEEAAARPDGEKWSIQEIAEHLSMVDFGITRICAKLLEGARADAGTSDGNFALSEAFGERAAEIAGLKVDAPERVHPTGSVTIAESLERFQANGKVYAAMRDDLERLDFLKHKFPHPFFGDLTAGEWLVMAGLHQHRHTGQIENVAAKIRQEKIPG